jgi:hypothetical protein
MAGLLPWAEIEFRVAALAPISRAAHLAGPGKHAERLIDIWQVAASDDVPLEQAWRLLDREAVAGAILRTLAAGTDDASGDCRYWTFPSLADLLPELQELAWQSMLAGDFVIEGIKGVRGKWAKRGRAVSPVELPLLRPDWSLCRLTRDGQDEYIEARVRRAAAEPPNRPSEKKRPSRAAVEEAVRDIAFGCPAGTRLSEATIWATLKERLGAVTRRQMRNAVAKVAPQLKIPPGYHT